MLCYHRYYKKIEVLTAVIMKNIVFMDLISFNLLDCYQHFERLLPPSSGPLGQQILGETMVVIYLTTRRHIADDSHL
jgi:hypothetical protein